MYFIVILRIRQCFLVLLIIIAMIIWTCTISLSNVQIKILAKQKNMSICNIGKKAFNEDDFFTSENWILEIPKIQLKANIYYGTTKEVMDKYIGHFDNTKFWSGNIGLAAHNRGYKVNYFCRLKELQIGDEIKYTTVFGTRVYKVEVITIIEDTDWSYLQETKENRITLITCVENEPNHRRCIQGIEE